MNLSTVQDIIRRTYHERDAARGVGSTFMWFTEEVGELAQAIRKGDAASREAEFADVLAWLATLANLSDVDLTKCFERYAKGCPRCHAIPCSCPRR